VITPDLRGFGESDKHDRPPADAYSAAAQARSVAGLIDELGLHRPVLAGYDIGSRIAQAITRIFPERAGALVIAPPLPGAGNRVFTAEARLVPGRRRHGRHLRRRAGARSRRAHHDPSHRAVARARPPVPAQLVGPAGRILHQC